MLKEKEKIKCKRIDHLLALQMFRRDMRHPVVNSFFTGTVERGKEDKKDEL